jgi:hypothetical protein
LQYEALNTLLSTCWVSDPSVRPAADILKASLSALQLNDIPGDAGIKKNPNGIFSELERFSQFSCNSRFHFV